MTPIVWVLLAGGVVALSLFVARAIHTMNPSGPLLDTEKEGSQ